jgi:hypothetical protein
MVQLHNETVRSRLRIRQIPGIRIVYVSIHTISQPPRILISPNIHLTYTICIRVKLANDNPALIKNCCIIISSDHLHQIDN